MRPKKRPVGRPRVGNVKLQFALSPEAARIIRTVSKRQKISRSDFIELLIRYADTDLPETVFRAIRARLEMEKPTPKPKTKPAKPMPKPTPPEVPGNPAQ